MNHPNVPTIESIPSSVAWLGYGGLLPFVGLAAGCFTDAGYGSLFQVALIHYGVVILSFVGALHWAFAMTLPGLSAAKRRECFVWSIAPALLAWVATLLIAVPAQGNVESIFYGFAIAAALLIVGFVANYVQDVRLARVAALPLWYLPLRLRLTTVACICVAAAGLARLLS
ncbi:MAG: DUF3429 domain-containing protein [Rhizobacter sp.]|nr:DUF3429 domain-containing protein [Burkholderiales bacterium]